MPPNTRRDVWPSLGAVIVFLLLAVFYSSGNALFRTATSSATRRDSKQGNVAPYSKFSTVGAAQIFLENFTPKPTVCAHRGVNDQLSRIKVVSRREGLKDLCLNHRICCFDMDVSMTSDGVLVLGDPRFIYKLFPPGDFPSTRDGGGVPEVKEYSWEGQIRKQDPIDQYFMTLQSFLELLLELGASQKQEGEMVVNPRSFFITLEPKDRTVALRRELIAKFAPMVLAVEKKLLAEGGKEGQSSSHQGSVVADQQSSRLFSFVAREEAEIPSELLPASVPYCATLRDWSLKEKLLKPWSNKRTIVNRNGESELSSPLKLRQGGKSYQITTWSDLKEANEVCLQLCRGSEPTWASHLAPSAGFVKLCSLIMDQTLTRYHNYLKTRGGKPARGGGHKEEQWSNWEELLPAMKTCSKQEDKGLTGKPHDVWIIDQESDFAEHFVDQHYHPKYIVSNKPVEIKGLLDSRGG